jgi:hypothetical protein
MVLVDGWDDSVFGYTASFRIRISDIVNSDFQGC